MHANLSRARLNRLRDGLSLAVLKNEVPGMVALVSRRREVHVEAFGFADIASASPMRRDTIFRIASLSKPITAVAGMILIEEATIRLDDPISKWIPEMAEPKVLRSLEGPLTDTVPAARPITVRDLFTFRMGIGAVMAAPDTYPIQTAIAEAGIAPGPLPLPYTPDQWVARLAALPLIHQPGERWMYHTGSDLLSVLISRASGRPFGDFLKTRIFEPLGMKDTGFYVPEEKIGRLATCYFTDGEGFGVFDSSLGGLWSTPPAFESGGGGLVSTADDYLAFAKMLLHGGEGILSRHGVELMTRDHISPAQKAESPFFPGFWDTYGWGFGVSVVTQPLNLSETVGRYGWDGGTGTSWRNDPREQMTCILLTQRLMSGPDDTKLTEDFLTLAYSAIED